MQDNDVFEKELHKRSVINMIPKIFFALIGIAILTLLIIFQPLVTLLTIAIFVALIVLAFLLLNAYLYFSENRKKLREMQRAKRKHLLAEEYRKAQQAQQ